MHSVAQKDEAPAVAPYTLTANVNRVLVPVVVRDKQGRAIGDLKKDDFQVFDNNKLRDVSGFTIEQRVPAQKISATEAHDASPEPNPANAATKSPLSSYRFLIFVFDDMHLNFEGLAHAKKAGAEVLAESLGDSDMAAVVSLSGQTNSGLTKDRTKLQKAIMSLHTSGLYTAAGGCPAIDYYQADLIENKHSPAAIASAVQEVFNCAPGMDPKRDQNLAENMVESTARRALNIGHQDVQSTFDNLAEIVRRVATLPPGPRTLILISSGFLALEADALTQESRVIDLAAQSNLTISALDARGLYTTEFTASEHGPSLVGQNFRVTYDSHSSAMTSAENPLAELANGTGGTFFHNSNDLNAGFKSLSEAPEFVYLLEFPLGTGKPDGSYHKLKVKVDRDGLQLQARSGYFVPKPEKDKR